jgi:hypothetical protein
MKSASCEFRECPTNRHAARLPPSSLLYTSRHLAFNLTCRTEITLETHGQPALLIPFSLASTIRSLTVACCFFAPSSSLSASALVRCDSPWVILNDCGGA